MHSWRQKLLEARERMQDDDDDNEFALGWVLGLDLGSSSSGKRARVYGGSCPRKYTNVLRGREEMHNQLMWDYFGDNPVFGPHLFRR